MNPEGVVVGMTISPKQQALAALELLRQTWNRWKTRTISTFTSPPHRTWCLSHLRLTGLFAMYLPTSVSLTLSSGWN